jgi:hypothetical protein
MSAPFTVGYLDSRLEQIYGPHSVEVDPVNCLLTVTLYEGGPVNIDSVYTLLFDVVPAHIEIRLIKQGAVEIDDTAYVGMNLGSYSKVSIPIA